MKARKAPKRNSRDYGTCTCPDPVRLRTSEPQAQMPPTDSKLLPQRKQLAGTT